MTSTGSECDYSLGAEYWASQAADVKGMLGGFDALSTADVRDSHHFIRLLAKEGVSMNRALDCGSGIGRVTKFSLLPFFRVVDMVDVTDTFIKASQDYLGPELNSRIGQRWISGLQDFHPPKAEYDVVWIQWVSGYLNDDDFVAFLRRCSEALVEGGAVVVKENLCSVGSRDFDPLDSSYARSRDLTVKLAKDAGLTVFLEKKQRNFPKGMLPVRMFAFRPHSLTTLPE